MMPRDAMATLGVTVALIAGGGLLLYLARCAVPGGQAREVIPADEPCLFPWTERRGELVLH